MKNILFLLLFAVSGSLIGQNASSAAKSESAIKWLTISEAVQLNQSNPKKFIVDIYTDWCGWCKTMDRTTFSETDIASYINAHYYPVKLNAEQKEDIIINGQTFKFVENGRRGYHELAAALTNGQLSYPTVVLIDEKLAILEVSPGYKKPAEMDMLMHYYGDDAHKTISPASYRDSFKSKFPSQ